MAGEFFNIAAMRDEEEGLFARDVNGQLIRLVKAVAEDFDKEITLKIDGQTVAVKKAVPATDSQGNPLKDEWGRVMPRATTIYDAAQQLFVKGLSDRNPIPVLCHQQHVDPVAVCRVCVVEIAKMRRGKFSRERKLLPACQHRVEDTMEVQTIDSPDPEARERVRSQVRMLTELLIGDHLQGRTACQALAAQPFNELAGLAVRLGIEKSRFAPPTIDRGRDDSSRMIAVDHNACILCDRCVRGCDVVRENMVIGHTGKGYATRISFDLDNPMGESTCISCGECMISCPTGALTLRSGAAHIEGDDNDLLSTDTNGAEGVPISVVELKRIPLFSAVSYKFLDWNSRSIRRRQIAEGAYLCRKGEWGTTAFVLLSGEYEVRRGSSIKHVTTRRLSGWRRFLGHIKTTFSSSECDTADGSLNSSMLGSAIALPGAPIVLKPPADIIIGEMTCLNHYPRSATIVARTGGEVLEINRNVLYMLQRDRDARQMLEMTYRARALENHLQNISLFKSLTEAQRKECVEFLRDRISLIHIDPGEVIFRQGEVAEGFYMVRLGFVKVAQTYRGEQVVLDYLGPGRHVGEIGLLAPLSEQIARNYPQGVSAGIRTATCSALDDVELVVVRSEDFRSLLDRYPTLFKLMVEQAKEMLDRNEKSREQVGVPLEEFLEQGLYDAQKLLVLDLEKCTRCDECTKACADSHEGVTRLIREGLRFDKFLVASSCRSCLDPYCLVGCPVDAIHRLPRDKGNPNSAEIVIEDWCIGCGQCAKNCPYGNINMHDIDEADDESGQQRASVQRRATTCDLCHNIVGPDGDVSCVYACPHDAASRMSGARLYELVNGTKK